MSQQRVPAAPPMLISCLLPILIFYDLRLFGITVRPSIVLLVLDYTNAMIMGWMEQIMTREFIAIHEIDDQPPYRHAHRSLCPCAQSN